MAPSATATMLTRLPRSRARCRRCATSSRSNCTSGMRISSAPPASPPSRASQPASRPMISQTITRWWLEAVVCRRSSASITMFSACRSRWRTPCRGCRCRSSAGCRRSARCVSSHRRRATLFVSSPPIVISASMSCSAKRLAHLLDPALDLERDWCGWCRAWSRRAAGCPMTSRSPMSAAEVVDHAAPAELEAEHGVPACVARGARPRGSRH